MLLIVLSILFSIPYSPHLAIGNSPPVISIFNENTNSNDTVDPSQIIGSTFTIDLQASNLPPITSPTSGGLEGFDITLSYNATILKASSLSFTAPECPSSKGCVFDLPANDTLTYADSTSAGPGTARLATITTAANHRAVDSSQTSTPTILFRAKFMVVGNGLTPLIILPSSQLLGFANNFCALTSYGTRNGSFDNRPPFTVYATPPSLAVSAGHSASTMINVTATRPSETVNATLLVSGLIDSHSSYSLTPRSKILSPTSPSFTSILTINTQPASVPQRYPLEIIASEPPPLNAAYNQYRLPFNFTIIAPGSLLLVQSHNSSPAPQFPTRSRGDSLVSNSRPPILATFVSSSLPGKSVSLNSTVWCGTPPYTYLWSFGDGSTASESQVTHTYASGGTYNVALTITDSNHQSYSSSQMIVVEGAPQAAASLDMGTLSAVIIIILVLVAGSALLLRGRKRQRK